jgi:hypothetical protein
LKTKDTEKIERIIKNIRVYMRSHLQEKGEEEKNNKQQNPKQ